MRLSKQALAHQRLAQLSMWLMICGFKPLWTSQTLKEEE